MKDRRLEEVLRHLHPPTGFKPWHGGPTILGTLRGVSERTAAWRPEADRHSIWELALHGAYWNYAVRRRLTGEPKGRFPRSPSNWPRLPAPATAEEWRDDRRLVRREHDRLVEAIEHFDSRRLDKTSGKAGVTFADLVTGVLLHDTYHAGQIQLLKRLARSRGI